LSACFHDFQKRKIILKKKMVMRKQLKKKNTMNILISRHKKVFLLQKNLNYESKPYLNTKENEGPT